MGVSILVAGRGKKHFPKNHVPLYLFRSDNGQIPILSAVIIIIIIIIAIIIIFKFHTDMITYV